MISAKTPKPLSSCINLQQLTALYETAPEVVLDNLGSTFLRTTPPLISELASTREKHDSKLFAEHAHQLRGNAAAIAAERLQALAQRVEQLADVADWTQIDIWFPALTHEANQVLAALRSRTDML